MSGGKNGDNYEMASPLYNVYTGFETWLEDNEKANHTYSFRFKNMPYDGTTITGDAIMDQTIALGAEMEEGKTYQYDVELITTRANGEVEVIDEINVEFVNPFNVVAVVDKVEGATLELDYVGNEVTADLASYIVVKMKDHILYENKKATNDNATYCGSNTTYTFTYERVSGEPNNFTVNENTGAMTFNPRNAGSQTTMSAQFRVKATISSGNPAEPIVVTSTVVNVTVNL